MVVTLALLPAMVQVVILLVNGNLGAGVAVVGAFSLVRFRSAGGSAREITAIFLAMTLGLATGMGYIGMAIVIVGVMCTLLIAYAARFGESPRRKRSCTSPSPNPRLHRPVRRFVWGVYPLGRADFRAYHRHGQPV